MVRRACMLFWGVLSVLILFNAVQGHAQKISATIPVGYRPNAIALNPVTNKIYVAHQFDSFVTLIDGATNHTTNIAMPSVSSAIAVNPVTNKIYVACGGGTLAVIDGATNAVTNLPIVNGGYQEDIGAVAVNSATNKIYVAGAGSGFLSVVDGDTNKHIATISGLSPWIMVVNEQTNQIYGIGANQSKLLIFDAQTSEVKEVDTGIAPESLALDPGLNKVFVGHGSSSFVTVVDGNTATATRIDTPSPDQRSMSVDAIRKKAYVGNGGTLVIIDETNNTTKELYLPGNVGADLVTVNPAIHKIYTANDGLNSLAELDGATLAAMSLKLQSRPHQLLVNPATNKVYILNTENDSVTVVDGDGSGVPLSSTSTTFTANANPVNLGTTINFTAKVSSKGTHPPTGGVTFRDGSTGVCSAPLNTSGVASCSTWKLRPGVHSITAGYSGDTYNIGSASAVIKETVNGTLSATTTTVTASPNPADQGNAIKFTAKVTSSGTHAPTGTVAFQYLSSGSAYTFGTATVYASGVASLSYNQMPLGTFPIVATYSGDTFNKEGASAQYTLKINSPQKDTTIKVTASPNPAPQGTAIRFTITVVHTGCCCPTGTVALKDGVSVLAVPALNSVGVATWSTSALAAGSHSISAEYLGDANNFSSVSPVLNLQVNAALSKTTTALTASPNPAIAGKSVTFTAIVSTAGTHSPSGKVTFKDGTKDLGAGTLNASRVASLTTSALAFGAHSITAVYGGDTYNATSTSSAVTENIESMGVTTTTLTSSLNPAMATEGINFTAKVTTTGSHPPAGSVTFKDGSTTLGTAALNTLGIANYLTLKLGVGTHSITAVCAGDTNNNASTSTAVSQVINPWLDSTNTSLTVTPNPAVAGKTVTLTATVSTKGSHAPTGTATFKDGATVLSKATPLAGAAAQFTITTLSVGSHNLTATYSGDAYNRSGNSNAVLEVINSANNPVPHLIAISPKTIPAGSNGFTLTLTGSNFVKTSVVRWNGYNRSTTVVSSTQLTAAIPATDLVAVTGASVSVFNPAPGGGASNAFEFDTTTPTPASAPKFSPAGGSYATAQSVTISDSTPGAVIYFTLDNSTPTTASLKYFSAITVPATMIIKAIATAPGYAPSAVSSSTYTITSVTPAAAPVITSSAAKGGAVIAAMTSSTPGAVIHFTLDGSSPTSTSPTYQAPFLLVSNMTVKAIAAAPGYGNSPIASQTFTLNILAGTLVWSDEFTNATGGNLQPNSKVWTYDAGGGGWGNGELETYCAWNSTVAPCDSAKPNSYVGSDSALHIVARQTFSGGYTSARIKSQGLLNFQYGRVEVRAKVPEGQGLWPAIWLLGNNINTVGWPACGEQDIVERVGKAGSPDWNVSSVHGTGFIGADLGGSYNFPTGQTASGWHVYGMIWKKGSISYYVDDPAKPFATFTPASLNGHSGAVWPFDSGNPAFLIFNVAVGGGWPGYPDYTTLWPAELVVDYVRVYTN